MIPSLRQPRLPKFERWIDEALGESLGEEHSAVNLIARELSDGADPLLPATLRPRAHIAHPDVARWEPNADTLWPAAEAKREDVETLRPTGDEQVQARPGTSASYSDQIDELSTLLEGDELAQLRYGRTG